jgi:hypothetical protein
MGERKQSMRFLIAVFLASYFSFNSWAYLDGYTYNRTDDWGTLASNGSYAKDYKIFVNPGSLGKVTLWSAGAFTMTESNPCGPNSCTATVSFDNPPPGDYSATLTACTAAAPPLGHCVSLTIRATVQ